MTAPVRVAICTPCQDQVTAGYALDLAKLVGYETLRGTELVLLQVKGTLLPQQRSTLAQHALDAQATHLLWIDADMRFPKDALAQLLAHNIPIVAANYPTRRPPILPTAEDRERGLLFTTDDASGLVEVSHAGMGLMLVTATAIQQMSKPYFALGYNKHDDGWVGEDVYFCRKARELGSTVHVDQDLSKEVRHVGEMAFSSEHACQTRNVYLEQQESQVVTA